MANRYIEQIMTAAQQGTVVLTANKRLYRHLRTAFDRFMIEKKALVWPSACIFPYTVWLQQCLDVVGIKGNLLTAYQQYHLWENLISSETSGTPLELMNLDRTTDTAVRAHNLLSEYDLELEHHHVTDDQRMFLEWRRKYQHVCEQHQWFDEGTVAARVLAAFADGELVLPQSVLLVGFDQLPPGVIKLKKLMAERGCRCRELDMSQEPVGRAGLFAAADEADETLHMARWIRLLLEKGAESIGIVVPDLQRRRLQIERVLGQQIDPLAAVKFDETSLFGLSLGTPLVQQGVVAAALACLDVQPQLTMDRVSYLLRTPFMSGSQQEADRRALFDRRLRSFQQQQFSFDALLRLSKDFGGLPLFYQLLSQLKNVSKHPATAEEWADIFAAELNSCGWPAGASLSSLSYQAVKAWYDKVLGSFAMVDPSAIRLERSRAVRIVRRIATQTEFQPQRASGPVQVVGLLESSGLHFEYLWVMGLDATTLPAYPRPNPFIPFRLQDELQMPHASFSRELEFAGQVLSRLRCAADDIVFSYPQRSGDTDLSPSPLLAAFDPIENLLLAPRADLSYMTQMIRDALESWQDDQGPSLPSMEAAGGTRLLQDQAHCPFRAFVHHRLAVRRLDQSVVGLSPSVRGELLHLVLEDVWRQLQSQKNYLQLSVTHIQQVISEAVEKALSAQFSGVGEYYPQLHLLEKQRLIKLVTEWFEKIESCRDPFVVVQTEQRHQVNIGPLQLTLKVDRVDQLTSGARIIIDYKSGSNVSSADFLTVPLIEPQLPSYAVAGGSSDQIAGIVIALVKAGNCRLSGISSEDKLLDQVRSVTAWPQAQEIGVNDWDALNDFWRQQLEQLAVDFAAGVAIVNPFDRQRSCRYCDLPGLCRIGEIEEEGNNE